MGPRRTIAAVVSAILVFGLAVSIPTAVNAKSKPKPKPKPKPVSTIHPTYVPNPPYALCLKCHAGQITRSFAVQSARDWMTTAGQGTGEWAERGVHSQADLGRCFWCHKPKTEPVTCSFCHSRPHDFAQSYAYPPGANPASGDCGATCHVWVPKGATVTTGGFVNAGGDPAQTTYRGPVNPGEMLAATTTAHGANFGANGCAACHPSDRHGEIRVCKTCHLFAPEAAAELNMHTTHIPFVQGEQPLVDPASAQAGSPACSYCHGSEGNAKRSCWNCHLSAHNPITPYWELPPVPPA